LQSKFLWIVFWVEKQNRFWIYLHYQLHNLLLESLPRTNLSMAPQSGEPGIHSPGAKPCTAIGAGNIASASTTSCLAVAALPRIRHFGWRVISAHRCNFGSTSRPATTWTRPIENFAAASNGKSRRGPPEGHGYFAMIGAVAAHVLPPVSFGTTCG
jgi:hypothetical protein